MRRVRLKDIAEQSGVTVSCVSQALRNLPGIAESTKKRIQKLAEELGYRPDPTLSALISYRSSIQPVHFRSVLGFITDGLRSNELWPQVAVARARAELLGYKLDALSMESPKDDWKKLLRICKVRGIRGVLVASRQKFHEPFPKTDVSDFCLVAIGYSIDLSGIHRVTTNQFLDMSRHVDSLRRLGYRRIGLWVPASADTRVHHQFTAGFFAASLDAGHTNPIFSTKSDMAPSQLRRWVEAHGLDAVIGLPRHLDKLRKAGFQVPLELGFSTYDWHGGTEVRQMSGVDYHAPKLIEAGIDLLHSLLLRNITGLSNDYPLTLYSGDFVEGKTTLHKKSVK